MPTTIETICWRRIDMPGHDACRLDQRDDGWLLDGAAVCQQNHAPAHLAYRLVCDSRWRPREGVVTGWIGDHDCHWRILRTVEGRWTLNGETVPDVDGLLDLDFGFTPATNLSQLRRLALDVGQAADVPAAWLDVTAGTVTVLQQRYERRTTDAYGYEAPRFGFTTQLRVRPSGFVHHYPPLWEEERS